MILERPQSEESGSRYLSLVPQQGDLANIFVEQGNRVESFILGLSDEEAMHRYQPEKWSVKEVIGHLIDTERVCAYRLLCAARGDRTPMASFDEDWCELEAMKVRLVALMGEENTTGSDEKPSSEK